MNHPSDSPASRLSKMLAYNLTQMIYVAVKLSIPDHLASGPKGVDELATLVSAHPQFLYRLLRALASVGVFNEELPAQFALTSVSELLRTDVPNSMRPFALSYGEPWWWNAWGNLLHSVQTGQTAFDSLHQMSLFEYLSQSPEAARIFNENMTAMTTQEALAVVGAYDFSQVPVVVDVAGGHGVLVTNVLRANPQVHAIVFDQPSVVEGTRVLMESAGLSERCQVIGGSFFETIPEGGDVYLLKDILHDWNDPQAVAILHNLRQSMDGSAKLLVIERIIQPGNDPMVGKIIDITMLVMTGGRERTEVEYRGLLKAGGFRVIQIYETALESSIIEAIPE